MNLIKIFFFLMFSLDAMAVMIKWSSQDKSGLSVEINDLGTKAQTNFASNSTKVKTDAIKVFSGLNYQFVFNAEGTQATLRVEKYLGKIFSSKSGLIFNCKRTPNEITCKSIDEKMAIIFKGFDMEIYDKTGRTKQSFVRTDAVITYQTNLGMVVSI